MNPPKCPKCDSPETVRISDAQCECLKCGEVFVDQTTLAENENASAARTEEAAGARAIKSKSASPARTASPARSASPARAASAPPSPISWRFSRAQTVPATKNFFHPRPVFHRAPDPTPPPPRDRSQIDSRLQ